jgi:ectoine hydroxylase-related dioxygenase (phytanoyl-CoA dioxygenase family)
VSVDPVSDASGGVKYLIGSHQAKVTGQAVPFTTQTDVDIAGAHRVAGFEDSTDETVSWLLAPGDCVVHHGLTLHASLPNTTADTARRALIVRFVGEDIRWFPQPNTIDIPDPQLTPGQTLASDLFPIVWSRS